MHRHGIETCIYIPTYWRSKVEILVAEGLNIYARIRLPIRIKRNSGYNLNLRLKDPTQSGFEICSKISFFHAVENHKRHFILNIDLIAVDIFTARTNSLIINNLKGNN